MDLSPDQREVYNAISRWSKGGSSLLTCGGLAGSGKTTLLGLFAASTSLRVAYVCPTGRAASILRRKFAAVGVESTRMMLADDERVVSGKWGHLFYRREAPEERMPFCDTIHRLLYRPVIDSRTEELRGWEKRATLDRSYDLIVADESSMIGSRMLADIRAHGVRVLAVGDHGQLPPVRDSGTLMMNPMLRLEKIHRQAESSPIIRLAHAIRTTGRIDPSLADGDAVRILSKWTHYEQVLRESLDEDRLNVAIVCWKHATRVKVNRAIRTMLSYDDRLPQKGEPILALHNYPPIYNGMRGLLTANAEQGRDWWTLYAGVDFPDDEVRIDDQRMCARQFHRLPAKGGSATFGSIDELRAAGIKVESMGEAGRLMDYGYAMTVHKAQGSSFDHVIVCVDWPETGSEESRRMAYTAITRASRKVTILK